MDKFLVSIIIPTFNRAHLIGETLDSIIAQTYQNWECIVVDDGSTDNTHVVMQSYIEKDCRVRFFHRPDTHLPGGNGARNYGFMKSRGVLIQWFDSDDLLIPEALELKVKVLIEGGYDFVISRTRYFNREEASDALYAFKEADITFENYSTGPISWYTPDMLIRHVIAEKIRFNERMRSGQEYNYTCKLLLETTHGGLIPLFTTRRRYTPDSIGAKRRSTQSLYHQTRFQAYWLNYLELHAEAKSPVFDRHTLLVCVSSYAQAYPDVALPEYFTASLKAVFGYRILYFYLMQITLAIFGKYHFFYIKLKH